MKKRTAKAVRFLLRALRGCFVHAFARQSSFDRKHGSDRIKEKSCPCGQPFSKRVNIKKRKGMKVSKKETKRRASVGSAAWPYFRANRKQCVINAADIGKHQTEGPAIGKPLTHGKSLRFVVYWTFLAFDDSIIVILDKKASRILFNVPVVFRKLLCNATMKCDLD